MKVLIAGGYGFLGRKIAADLFKAGYNITIAGRHEPENDDKSGISHLKADLMIPGSWQKDIREFDVIINLVGVNIFQRWNSARKKEIYDSRIISTRNIVDALKESGKKKKILINASAVGFYGAKGDEEVTERTPYGDDFLSMVCRDWEAEAVLGEKSGMRVALLRFGTVLGAEGGAFIKLRQSFRLFLGAKLGNGKQWFPWIHIDDVSGIILKIIKNSKMSGPYNCTSPGAVTNDTFTVIMADEVHRPVLMPFIPEFALKLAFGEFGGYLVHGQKVAPSRLLEEGYRFRYADLRKALKALLN